MEPTLKPANTAAIHLTMGGSGMAARYAVQAMRSAERAAEILTRVLEALEALREAFTDGGNEGAAAILDELILDLSTLK